MNAMPNSAAEADQPLAFDAGAVARWRPQSIVTVPGSTEIALIGANAVKPIIPGLDLWDCWPLAHEDGRTAEIGGRQYWFFLSAPIFPDPVQRHDHARIRLASMGADGWRDHGNAMPDGFSPGSREWAGSAILHDDGISVSLFFTAAGRRDGPPSVEQRLFVVHGAMGADGPGAWADMAEIVRADGRRYTHAAEASGKPGLIKAFRDPAWFVDPATGERHILFTGSAGWSDDDYNGVVGIASLRGQEWVLGDPLVEAVGVNNELERAHVVVRDGHYYLFWSTQTRTFAPDGEKGPNGLYAMVADSLVGPWRPVNGSGLVAGNPAAEPTQGYSWWVTGEGAVWSFIDHWGMRGRSFDAHPELLRAQFGGTPAPVFRLNFAGDSVTISA